MKPKSIFFCKSALRTKMIFASEEEADRFILFNAKEMLDNHARKVPVRSYFCQLCNGWHTTSNPDVEFFSSYHSRAELTMLNILERKDKNSRRSVLMRDNPVFSVACKLFNEGKPFEAMEMIVNYCNRNNGRFIQNGMTVELLGQSFGLFVEYIRTVDIRILNSDYTRKYNNLHKRIVKVINKTGSDYGMYLSELRDFKKHLPPIILTETEMEQKRQINMRSTVKRHLNKIESLIKFNKIEQAKKRITEATGYINKIAECYEDRNELIALIDNLIIMSKTIEEHDSGKENSTI